LSIFRFIHTADIHLGSFLHISGMEKHPKLKELSRKATYQAFENICNIAVENKAAFILISGDLYDREARSVRANRFFVDACRRLEKERIRVFVTAGNHDPAKEYKELFRLPDNVYVFSASEPELILVNDTGGEPIAAVSGQSYGERWERSPLHAHYPVSDADVFRIAMLHTQLETGRSNYIPASSADLSGRSGFDYWALGHIHQPQIIKEDKPVIAYSGAPQGRDFGEQGLKGCWLVEVEKIGGVSSFRANMKFQVTSPVIYHTFFIDIGCPELAEAESFDQLEAYLIEEAEKLEEKIRAEHSLVEGILVRWEIGGRGRLHFLFSEDIEGSQDEIRRLLRTSLGHRFPFVWTDSVILRTKDPAAEEVLVRHPMLKEYLDQIIMDIRQGEPARKSLISQLGQMWTQKADYEDMDEKRFFLDESTLENMLDEAVQLILNGLIESGGRE
jgi:exonuclease SbcD